MGWFDRDETKEKLLEELRALRKDVAALRVERDAESEALKAQRSINDLRREIMKLEIERDKKVEAHERERRELQHMIGLEKKRQEFEVSQAKRETTVSVREENLKADRERFEEQMKFNSRRFEEEVRYLKELMGEILERLPHVEVDMAPASGRGRAR